MIDPLSRRVEIIPAILPKSVTDLEINLTRIENAGGTVQVDMVDGVYAKNKTWPYSAPGSFETFVSGDEGLPHWGQFDFQFDVMAEHPELDVENFVRAGAASVVVHAKAGGALAAVQLLQQYRGTELVPVEVGVALMPGASLDTLLPFTDLYDFVQVMGVGRIGFQGQEFDARCVELVQKLRAAHPDLCIQVDGGVTLEHVRALAQAGANRLVVGHDILEAEDPVAEISRLRGESRI
ncbi:MAG: hypothetical protein NT019_00405 [Candidatus Adlerbacteria bacterium]|nr:hypothetical protein [Candidatus Adlerbacteria bacterium]